MTTLPPLHLLELHFRVLKPINRLPHYHGPHWSAFVRTLLRAGLPAGDTLIDAVWVQPVENGISCFEPGDPLHLGLTCPAAVIPALTAALAKWDTLAAAGHFQPATLAFTGIFCRISGQKFDPAVPCYFEEAAVTAEIATLEKLDSFTLQLTSPMRLTRPEGCKEERHRYCDSDFFFGEHAAVTLTPPASANPENNAQDFVPPFQGEGRGGDGVDCGISLTCQNQTHPPPNLPLERGGIKSKPHPLQAILGRLRFPEVAVVETDGITMTGGSIAWLDAPYGSRSAKTIGGLVGALRFSGTPSPALARLLVLGQYLGAGKNAAFGFGFYSIPELDAVRSIAPLRRGLPLLHRGTTASALAAALRDLPASAPGPDCLTTSDIARAGRPLLDKISTDIRDITHTFGGFKSFLQPKTSGGFREINIQNASERLVFRALASELTPAIDRLLGESSYAYRRGLNRKAAATHLARLLKEGYNTGIKADIASFFDSVDTGALCDLFDGYFPHEPLGFFIRNFLSHAAESGIKGLPQGWSLSPVLSNLFLDRFDRMVEAAGFRLVRFSDDFVMLGKESGSPEAARQTALQILAKLGLTLKEEKIEPVEKGATIRFLGLAVTAGDVGELPPDESHEEEPWAPMFRTEWRTGRPVYLSSICRGAFSSGACLVIKLEGDETVQIPWNSISRIVIVGRSQVSGGVLYRAVKEETPVTFIDVMGRTRGHIRAEGVEIVNERELQLRRAADIGYCLSFARETVSAKITNSFVLLRRNSITEPALKELAEKAATAENVESLRGYEGAAGRVYWQHFATLVEPFEFKGRSYHPPDGAINVMLSFGYTLLYNRISAVLTDRGFDPRIGLFHQGRGTHNALASDLQEELRHIADRVVLALVHLKEITPENFTVTISRGTSVSRLGGEGFRSFIRRYESVMSAPFTREGVKTCYNEYLDDMASCLRRSMKLDIPFQSLRIR